MNSPNDETGNKQNGVFEDKAERRAKSRERGRKKEGEEQGWKKPRVEKTKIPSVPVSARVY